MKTFISLLVKTVFILCYAAFMWASIHHVAAFFNGFEADQNNLFGSYMLAGAFDVTALVTTIGVMFFRKSMPGWVFWIVWAFIIAIAIYSFLINWEYANRYQSMDLVLQPTGETTPVFDVQGHLHYVPVMKANTALLLINPFLSSGFTIFSLIYSVIAEFFGTKPPTADELKAKREYLESIQSEVTAIRELEKQQKGKGLIQSAKEKALEIKDAVKEVTKKDDTEEETGGYTERDTDELEALISEETEDSPFGQTPDSTEESNAVAERKTRGKRKGNVQAFTEENLPAWLSGSDTTISLQTVVKHTSIDIRKLRNRVKSKELRATKNTEIVYKDTLIEWLKKEGVIVETNNITRLEDVRNHDEYSEETRDESPLTSEEKLEITVAALRDTPDITDEQLSRLLKMDSPAKARFWRLKVTETVREQEAVNA